jgi:hypothetical protein
MHEWKKRQDKGGSQEINWKTYLYKELMPMILKRLHQKKKEKQPNIKRSKVLYRKSTVSVFMNSLLSIK